MEAREARPKDLGARGREGRQAVGGGAKRDQLVEFVLFQGLSLS